jgi:hypothetical protein
VQPYTPLAPAPAALTTPDLLANPAAQLLPPAPSAGKDPIQLAQAARGGAGAADDEAVRSVIVHLEPPTPKRVFRFESEQAWRQRIRQEALTSDTPDKIVFPEEPILTQDKYTGRHWPAMHMVVEPYFVGYNRLFFNQLNFERYGWDVGPVSSLISPLLFFKDLLLVPYHQFTDPLRNYDYNTGYCLPGDPVPLRLYPEGTSATGLAAEVGVLMLVLAVFP